MLKFRDKFTNQQKHVFAHKLNNSINNQQHLVLINILIVALLYHNENAIHN